MICKFCNNEIEEQHVFCPFCGKSQNEEPAAEQESVVEKEVVTEQETAVVQEEAAVEQETVAQQESVTVEAPVIPVIEVKPKKTWKLVLAIVGGVLALGILAVVLLIALGVDMKPPANDVFRKDSYTVEEDKFAKSADTVVATVGNGQLTNAQLQVYYRMQIQDFLQYYGSYLDALGLNFETPLSEQTCYFDDTMNWQQYFLDISINTWKNHQLLVQLAEEAQFSVAELEKELETFPELMEKQAQDGKYESAQAMLAEVFGDGCDLDDYTYYVRMATLSNEFYVSEYQRLMPTDEEVEEYFTQNQELFEQEGISKDSGLNATVRHILLSPEGGTTAEDGTTVTYSEDEWAACKAKAESVLEEWKQGEATEESFAQLANTYSADGGSNTTGGLYSDVNATASYVEPFRNWAVDVTRQTGDTDIVKTEFGYHIMYFVSGELHWMQAAKGAILSERTNDLIGGAEEKWPAEVTYRKIVMTELDWN